MELGARDQDQAGTLAPGPRYRLAVPGAAASLD